VHHLSGNRDVSYAEVGRMAAELASADEKLVDPAWAPPTEPAPRHTTLDVAGLPASLGVTVPDVSVTIRHTLQGLTLLADTSDDDPWPGASGRGKLRDEGVFPRLPVGRADNVQKS
jgi:hypothetical protein